MCLTGLHVSSLLSWNADAMLFCTALIQPCCCRSESACKRQLLHKRTRTHTHKININESSLHVQIIIKWTYRHCICTHTLFHSFIGISHYKLTPQQAYSWNTLTWRVRQPQSRTFSPVQHRVSLCTGANLPPPQWAAPKQRSTKSKFLGVKSSRPLLLFHTGVWEKLNKIF